VNGFAPNWDSSLPLSMFVNIYSGSLRGLEGSKFTFLHGHSRGLHCCAACDLLLYVIEPSLQLKISRKLSVI